MSTGLKITTHHRTLLCDKYTECLQQGMVDKGLWCGERSGDSRIYLRGVDSKDHAVSPGR